jgi:hypothetical protein
MILKLFLMLASLFPAAQFFPHVRLGSLLRLGCGKHWSAFCHRNYGVTLALSSIMGDRYPAQVRYLSP